MKKGLVLLLILGAGPLTAQEAPRSPQPQTALESLSVFKVYTHRDRVTGLVEVRGTGGTPTPEQWRVVVFNPVSPTKLSEYSIRGPRVEDRGAGRDLYPDREPAGYFDLAKINVDCAGAFRIADREAGKAKIGFDSIDYLLRCREFSEDPVWILTLRTSKGAVAGTVSISAVGGKVFRTVWMRPVAGGRPVVEDSAVPAEYRPAPPANLPDPFPAKTPGAAPDPLPPTAGTPLPEPIPEEPDARLPPPPPLPPLGAPPPIPKID